MRTFLIAVCLAALCLAGALAHAQTTSDPRGVQVVRQASPADTLRSGKAYALIIGTNQYNEWPALANPVHDAQSIADELKTNFGYQAPNVDLVLNPAKSDVSSHLRAFIDKPFGPNDSLLIFVAGHGKFDEALQQGYLVFKDSKKIDPLSDSYIAHSDLTRIVDRIRAKRILVIIDACFGGTIDDNVAHRGDDGDLAYPEATKAERLAARSSLKTRLYLTSGGKEYVQDGRPGANSPFAAEVLRALRNYDSTGLVTFNDLLQKAELVKGETPVHNWFGSSDTDADFWFVKTGSTLAATAAPPAPAGPKRGDQPPVLPAINLPATNGRNATAVILEGNGELYQNGSSTWFYQAAGGQGRRDYKETKRDDSSVYLTDTGSGGSVQLDLVGRRVLSIDGRGGTRETAKITDIDSRIHGWLVKRITYHGKGADGEFALAGLGVWVDRYARRSVDYIEESRDDWSVYLRSTSGGPAIQLDVFTREVKSPPGGSESAIASIIDVFDK